MLIKMQITDDTIIPEIYVADKYIKKLMGYMFRKRPHYNAILFTGCNSIHTYFMKFPIDVLFLDYKYQVMKYCEALEHGNVVMPIKGACYVLEGRAGLFKDIKIGQIINVA